MSATMMRCGHSATGRHGDDPCCVSCFGLHPGAVIVDNDPPNLVGRFARCEHFGQKEKIGCGCNRYNGCQCVQPSGAALAFFEYRGLGSDYAAMHCVCGYALNAHTAEAVVKPHMWRMREVCEGFFTPRPPAEYDIYYCGCRGWD